MKSVNLSDIINKRCSEASEACDKKDYAKAFEIWSECANFGHADSLYNLGLCYEFGFGTQRNEILAQEYFKRAAKKGSTLAKKKLKQKGGKKGTCLLIFFLVCVCPVLLFFTFAILAGIITASNEVAREAGRAEGRAEGRVAGRAEGREAGRAEGRAEAHAVTKATPPAQVRTLTREEIMVNEARQGSPARQMQLGIAYLKGEDGIPFDPQKAYVWLYRAAEKGNSESFSLLKEILFRSHLNKVLNEKQNSGKAGEIVSIGFLYYFGIFVEQDKAEAHRLFYLAGKINPSMQNMGLILLAYENNPNTSQQYIALSALLRGLGEGLAAQMMEENFGSLEKIKNYLVKIGCNLNL